MPAPRVRANYDQLARIAAAFDRQAGETQRLAVSLTRQVQALESGDWAGRGAKAFYSEMDSQVLPSLRRLAGALSEAHRTTVQIRSIMKQAEDEAARLFRLMGGSSAMAAIPGVDFTVPAWVWDFASGLVPLGDAVDVIKQLWNRIRGREVDELVLTLALLGVVADLGWLNPIPSAEDAPNAVLAALKALAKQIPPGAARDSLQEMVELAAKNADEARRLGEVLVALTKNSDLAIALTKHPEALIAVMRHGPEAVELLGKFGDDAVTLVGKYGDDGIRILNRAETAAANAYDVARAGGIHSGTITTYASKPASELRRAAESYDAVVADHIRKLNDPGAYAEKWATGSDLYRQGLLRKWENDLVRNAELAEIMRNLLREASP
jgi:WXG100 family type VII secretion target